MPKSPSAHTLSVIEPLELRLLPDDGLHFEEPIPEAWVDTQLKESDAGPTQATAPGSAELDVEPLGPVATRPPIRVHGTLNVALGMTCVRCLQPVEQLLTGEIELTLFPEGTRTRDVKDVGADDELSAAELDEGTYGAEHIDLPAILRETMLLELPMNPSCADEAACSERTEAMLAEANRKSSGVIDDRWAALRHLSVAGKPGDES